MNIRNIPLRVLEVMEPYQTMENKLFERIEPDSFLLKFRDTAPDSKYYFNIESYRTENGFSLIIDFAPHSREKTPNFKTAASDRDLDIYFRTWVKMLEEYESRKKPYEDPILKSFEEEYYTEFEIVDESADSEPFDTKRILFLDQYLENIEENIDNFSTESNKEEIQIIKAEVVELRANLTNKSKQWIMKSFSKICAKIAKQGTKLIKEFLTEGKKEMMKRGVNLLIENGQDLIDGASNAVNQS